MIPPIYPIAKASAAVQVALGGPEPRLYPFDEAPANCPRPYAVYQVVTGSPENYLADRPDADSITIQVDVYASTQDEAMTAATALRDAIEMDCYITALRSHGRDPETRDWRVGFDCDWIIKR